MPGKLSPSQIHIWSARLDSGGRDPRQDCRLLSPDENARAERLRLEIPRKRFIFCRIFLRSVLAFYIESPPEEIRFLVADSGKPFLPHEEGRWVPAFNLSHSGDLALLGITVNRKIGVDLELMDENINFGSIARRYLSVMERKELEKVPETERREAFYRCWTRKEAYVKGVGCGIGTNWNRISVTITPDSPTMLLEDELHPDTDEAWLLSDLKAPPGFTAALATTGPPPVITYREFSFTDTRLGRRRLLR